MSDRAARARRVKTGAPPKFYPPSVVSGDARMGTDVVIGVFCYVDAGAVIGAGTRIQSHTSVWSGVTLGEDVFVGPAATFTNVRRPRAAFPRENKRFDETIVEDGATIGANAVLVAPLRIGRFAMIGAGAVVTHDVPAHALVIGSPARVVGWVCECGETVGMGEEPAALVCDDCRARA